MEPLSNILAGADDDLGRIIGVIVLVAFGIIGSLIKKGTKAREDREAQEREAARRRRQAVEAARGQQQAPAPPPILGKAARRAAAAAAAARTAQTAKRPPRRETLGEGVDDEMAQFARHQEQAQASRQSRLHLIDAEAVVVESPASLSIPVPRRPPIRLQGSAVAQAVILSEILSLPKAIRNEQELWDM